MSGIADKVVAALFKSIESQTGDELLPTLKPITASVSVIKIPDAKGIRMKFVFPNPIYHPSTSICCIVSDDDRCSRDYEQTTSKYDSFFNGGEYKFKFITCSQLKREYQPFEARKKLAQAYDLFMADSIVMPMMNSAAGRDLICRQRWPVGVHFKKYLSMKKERAMALLMKRLKTATTVYSSKGTSFSVRLCVAQQGQELCKEQVKALLQQLPEQIPGGRENIAAIHLCCRGVQSLPLYSHKCADGCFDIPEPLKWKADKFETEPEELDTLPDGKLIKFVSADDFVILDAKTGEVEKKCSRKKRRKWMTVGLIKRAKVQQDKV